MLTQVEQKALDYIAGYIHDNGGISPTYREIMHCMGWRTKGQIGFLLNRLASKGRLRRLSKRSRALEVIDASPQPKPVMRLGNAQFFQWDDEAQKLVPWSR